MAHKVNVGKTNTEKAVSTQEELEHGDRRYWTPTEGKNQIRIMPPPVDHDEYFFRSGFHYGIGPDDKMFPCPKIGGARRNCFLCEEADRLMRSSDEDDQADGKDLRASKKYLITVIDLDKPGDGFQVWSPGVKAFREVNYYFSDPDWGNVDDLEEGYDFIVIRKGSGLNTDYTVKVAKRPSNVLDFLEDRLDKYSDDMFDELPILEEFLQYATDTEMEAVYNGTSTGTTSTKRGKGEKDDDDEDDPEEEAPARGSGRRSSRSAPEEPRGRGRGPKFPDEKDKDDDKDDDDKDEDDDDEDDAEEEAPARGSGRSSGRSSTRSSGRASGTSSGRGSGRSSSAGSSSSSGRSGGRLSRGLRS